MLEANGISRGISELVGVATKLVRLLPLAAD
jgi:hypothetical protein